MRNAYLFKRPRKRHTTLRWMAASFALGALAANVVPDFATSTLDPPATARAEHRSSPDPTRNTPRNVRLSSAVADVDCADFDNQAEAQAFMASSGRAAPHRLDVDNDGIACERLP